MVASQTHISGAPSKAPSKKAVDEAVRRSQAYFRASQSPEGYWCGELESNPTMGG